MRLLLYYFVAIFVMVGMCSAELPGFYKTVDRVTWVVRDVDHVKRGWTELGLSDVHDYPDIRLTGRYQGKPVVITARRVTGRLGDLTVDMIQPAEKQKNAFNEFLARHGDGIFSIVHRVSDREDVAKEVQRMGSLGVTVLQQVSLTSDGVPIVFTYFDTEPRGKFVLGLVYSTVDVAPPKEPKVVSHLAPVILDPNAVSTFWSGLGFPAFSMEHATPREDSRYRGKPLWLAFDVGYQRYKQFNYEWICPPKSPQNIYTDFLKLHGEGIQHMGVSVDDLEKAATKYESFGYHVWQSGAWGEVGKNNSGQYDYMDTDSIGGVSVELIHAY